MKVTLKNINNFLFFLSILSIDFPVKIYPFFFVITSFLLLIECRKISLKPWMFFLGSYSIYAIIMYLISGQFDELRAVNFYKIFVNFLFLVASIAWLKTKNVNDIFKIIDIINISLS